MLQRVKGDNNANNNFDALGKLGDRPKSSRSGGDSTVGGSDLFKRSLTISSNGVSSRHQSDSIPKSIHNQVLVSFVLLSRMQPQILFYFLAHKHTIQPK
jgi:hypothetical protein